MGLIPRSCCQPATHERSDSTAAIGIFYFLNCLFLRRTFLLQPHSGYQMLTIPFPELIEKAQRIYTENFPLTTLFERAIFFSWGCTIGDCTFCYMSTQPADKPPKETKRSAESILAEFILAKKFGWDIGFFTGGIGVFTPGEMESLLRNIIHITQEKIWLSLGPLSKPLLQRYLPYAKGIVGSTETINPILHAKVCPSKPLKPYEMMFEAASELGLKKAMTFIVGMKKTKEDLPLR